MRNKILGLVAIIFFVIVGWTTTTYPQVGHLIYQHGLPLEASMYGLEKTKVDIGEQALTLYDNNNEGKSVIVMLHGYTADKNVWVRFAKHFTDNYHVIIPDLAGHGETPFDKNWDYSIPAQTERVIALLDKLGIEKAHVIGNSMGGFISATFAIKYPKRTLSSGLVDPAGVTSPIHSDMEKMLNDDTNPFQVMNDKGFENFYAMTMEKPPYAPQIVLDAVSEVYQERRDRYALIFDHFYNNDMLDNELANIKVPTLLMWGENDRLLHVSAVNVWQAGVEDIEVITWPDIGHMPMVEIPKLAAQRYQAFLNRL